MRGDFNDLTKGGVTKQLVRYAIPMVVTSLLQACYSMADLLIAGHFIGSSGISAINNSSQIVLILTNIAIGLTTGGTILIGQCFGAGSRERQKKATGTLVTLSMGLGALCAVIFFLAAEPMLRALGAPSLEEAKIYLQTCSVGLVFVFGYNALSSVLRAVGNSKQPFYFIAAAAMINVALDLFLMGYCRMGTLGAAVATTAAQGVSFLSALFYLLGRKELFQLKLEFLKIRVNELLVILRLGIPGAVQMTIAGVSWLVVTFLINQYGVDVSAGNGVSIKIKDFCQLFTSAMATSASAMIAQTLGAGLYDRAKNVTDTAMKITVAMSLAIIVLVELLAPQLAGLFTSDENVRPSILRGFYGISRLSHRRGTHSLRYGQLFCKLYRLPGGTGGGLQPFLGADWNLPRLYDRSRFLGSAGLFLYPVQCVAAFAGVRNAAQKERRGLGKNPGRAFLPCISGFG